jgi:hypothetical protein
MNNLVIKRPDFRFAKDCLNALTKLELKYLLIQNFFSEDETQTIVRDLRNLPPQLCTVVKPGFTVFPRQAFNIADPNENVNVYFSMSASETNNLKKSINVDVVERFNDVFKEINNAQTVEVLNGPDNGTRFVPVNFRLLTPEGGGLKAASIIHNGSNITARCANSTYKHLNGVIDFDNQLSFFSLLQNADAGGDLTIYDFKRDDYPAIAENRYISKPDGSRVDLETTTKKCTVHMEPGDLIIFPGGQLWHRVEVVTKGERISLGGFTAKRYSDNSWHYWI